MLNWGPLVWLGTLSYSLYLWQEPFLNHFRPTRATTYPLNLVLAFGCAVASYYLIEKPILTWRAQRAARAAAT